MKSLRHKKNSKKGMALLIAVIATSALLLASIAISDIAFKQQLISYSGRESKIAFYAADAGLECALYYDLKVDNFFPTPTNPTPTTSGLDCDGSGSFSAYDISADTIETKTAMISRFSYNLHSGECVIVDVTKIDLGSSVIKTYITSRGYNTTCTSIPDSSTSSGVAPTVASGARNVERALEVNY